MTETTTMTELEHTMNLEDTANLLGVAPRTIRRWVSARGLPAVRPGKVLLFSRAAVVQWHSQQSDRVAKKAQP